VTFIDALILGILQGITEFLPISSSGHLVLGQEVLGIVHAGNIAFEVFVHFGTLLSILVVFWRDVRLILFSLFKAFAHPTRFPALVKEDAHLRLAMLMILGSIPAAIVGLTLKSQFEQAFSSVRLVGAMLLVTGAVLFLTRFSKPIPGAQVNWRTALLIGCAQALAILPGISRAGMTISAGLFAGVAREEAARFSFLLALPVIFGASLLEALDISGQTMRDGFLAAVIIGTIAAFIAGYFAIKTIFVVLKRDQFSLFSIYCAIVGIFTLILA
jgi:undecaprenyl-diphosphatase